MGFMDFREVSRHAIRAARTSDPQNVSENVEAGFPACQSRRLPAACLAGEPGRVTAKQRIKQFLIATADKIGGAAAGVLQTYVEKKLLGL